MPGPSAGMVIQEIDSGLATLDIAEEADEMSVKE